MIDALVEEEIPPDLLFLDYSEPAYDSTTENGRFSSQFLKQGNNRTWVWRKINLRPQANRTELRATREKSRHARPPNDPYRWRLKPREPKGNKGNRPSLPSFGDSGIDPYDSTTNFKFKVRADIGDLIRMCEEGIVQPYFLTHVHIPRIVARSYQSKILNLEKILEALRQEKSEGEEALNLATQFYQRFVEAEGKHEREDFGGNNSIFDKSGDYREAWYNMRRAEENVMSSENSIDGITRDIIMEKRKANGLVMTQGLNPTEFELLEAARLHIGNSSRGKEASDLLSYFLAQNYRGTAANSAPTEQYLRYDRQKTEEHQYKEYTLERGMRKRKRYVRFDTGKKVKKISKWIVKRIAELEYSKPRKIANFLIHHGYNAQSVRRMFKTSDNANLNFIDPSWDYTRIKFDLNPDGPELSRESLEEKRFYGINPALDAIVDYQFNQFHMERI